MTAEQIKRAEAIIERTLQELSEYCDSIQILASWVDSDRDTRDIFRGRGNFYARTGMAQEFLARNDGQTVATEIAKQTRRDDDDDAPGFP